MYCSLYVRGCNIVTGSMGHILKPNQLNKIAQLHRELDLDWEMRREF